MFAVPTVLYRLFISFVNVCGSNRAVQTLGFKILWTTTIFLAPHLLSTKIDIDANLMIKCTKPCSPFHLL